MQIRTNYFSRWRLLTFGYCSWVLDTTPQVWLSTFLLGIPVLVDGGGWGGGGERRLQYERYRAESCTGTWLGESEQTPNQFCSDLHNDCVKDI